MSRTRASWEADLLAQIERMLHRSALQSVLVARDEQWTPLDAPARTLLRLIDEHDRVRSSVLAELTGLSRPSVSRYLASLEDAGLVHAAPDPTDGRASLLTLTPAGRARREQLGELGRRSIRRVTGDFSRDDLAGLTTLLTRLNDNASAQLDTTVTYQPEGALQ